MRGGSFVDVVRDCATSATTTTTRGGSPRLARPEPGRRHRHRRRADAFTSLLRNANADHKKNKDLACDDLSRPFRSVPSTTCTCTRGGESPRDPLPNPKPNPNHNPDGTLKVRGGQQPLPYSHCLLPRGFVIPHRFLFFRGWTHFAIRLCSSYLCILSPTAEQAWPCDVRC